MLLSAVYIPVTVGTLRFSNGFRDNPALWWLVIILLGSVLLMLRLAFPSRAAQARLEIRHDALSFVPRRLDRYLSGEEAVEVAVTPQATEILFCQSFFEDMPDGYRMVVRGAHEPEREVGVKFFKTPDSQDCQAIVGGMTAATGLPVRLVIRRRLTDGTVHEMPWTPITRKARTARGFAVTAMAVVPYIGGITIGYLQLRPALIVTAGLALWCGQVLAALAWARGFRSQTRHSTLYLFSTIFTFGAAYGLAVVIGAFVLRAR